MRDALIAGVTLDIFNHHCKRVRMANIAQMVNVLQSLVLTDGPDMVKTPTYYVFHMYRHHQGADSLYSYISGQETEGPEEDRIPLLSASASQKEGILTVTLNNLSLREEKEVEIELLHFDAKEAVEAKIVTTSDVRAFNNFREEEKITEKEFKTYTLENGKLKAILPAHSVGLLRIR